jgi:hypothetical protein
LPTLELARSHLATQFTHPTADTARAPSLCVSDAQDQQGQSDGEPAGGARPEKAQAASISSVHATLDSEIESRVTAVLASGGPKQSGLLRLCKYI